VRWQAGDTTEAYVEGAADAPPLTRTCHREALIEAVSALMPLKSTLVLLLALIALPATAAEPFYLDLNTPAEGVSTWAAGGLMPDGEIAARVSVIDVRADPKWEPGFEIMVTGGKGYVSLRTSFAKGGAQTARPRVVVWNNGAVVSDTPIGNVEIQKGQPVDLVLRWRADHAIEAYVGDASLGKPIQVPFTAQDVRIKVTTADVRFESVRVK
jgi:hypothetical protein